MVPGGRPPAQGNGIVGFEPDSLVEVKQGPGVVALVQPRASPVQEGQIPSVLTFGQETSGLATEQRPPEGGAWRRSSLLSVPRPILGIAHGHLNYWQG